MSELIGEYKTNIIGNGVEPGKTALDVAFWADSLNMDFDAFGVHTTSGLQLPESSGGLFDSEAGMFDSHAGLFDDAGGGTFQLEIPTPNLTITGLHQQRLSSGAKVVYIGTPDSIFRWDGGNVTTPGSGFSYFQDADDIHVATRWSSCSWNDWNLTTNGIDPVKIYKSGPSFVSLTGVNFTRAAILRSFGPFVIAFDTDLHDFQWCKENDPEEWDYTTARSAGFGLLKDRTGPMIAVERLGSGLGLYTHNSIWLLSYVGRDNIFGAKPMPTGIGAVSRNSIVPVGALNYGFTQGGIFVTDGVSARYVSYPALGEWLQGEVNWKQQSKICGYYIKQLQQIRWSYPSTGNSNNNKSIGYNIRTGQFSYYQWRVNAAVPQDIFDYPLVGGFNSKVSFAHAGNDDHGEAYSKYVQTKKLDFSMPGFDGRKKFKFIDVIDFDLAIKSGNGPTVQVGYTYTLNGATVWSAPFTLDQNNARIFPKQSVLFLEIKIQSSAVDDDWLLSNIRVYGQPDGRNI